MKHMYMLLRMVLYIIIREIVLILNRIFTSVPLVQLRHQVIQNVNIVVVQMKVQVELCI